MDPVSATTTIDAPRERVWDLICDLGVRPAFTDHFIDEYRLERLDPVGVGAAARFRLRDSGEWMDTVIEEASRPHLVRESGRGGRFNRIPVHTVWELVEGPTNTSCELTVTFWTEPSVAVDRLKEALGASRWFQRNWRRALARLRELAESQRPVERVVVAGADR
jgi:uncharacterized protein YndB with AHSA1/START domain